LDLFAREFLPTRRKAGQATVGPAFLHATRLLHRAASRSRRKLLGERSSLGFTGTEKQKSRRHRKGTIKVNVNLSERAGNEYSMQNKSPAPKPAAGGVSVSKKKACRPEDAFFEPETQCCRWINAL